MSWCNDNPINVDFPDVWEWICGLPPPSDWTGDAMSLNLCSCSQVSLLLSAIPKPLHQTKPGELVCFSLLADLHFTIPLWTSEPCRLARLHKEETMYDLFLSLIEGILNYGPQTGSALSRSRIASHIDSDAVIGSKQLKAIFNCAFLSLGLCVCFYEVPGNIRSWCVEALQREFEKTVKLDGDNWKAVLEAVGSNIEEELMRSMGLLITNRICLAARDLQGLARERSPVSMRIPCLPYSYGSCTNGLWKVRVYTPLLSMEIVDSHSSAKDDGLLIALSYLQLEAVLQLTYQLFFAPGWIEVRVMVDNIRCDVVPLVSHHGFSEEKHFPSRVSIKVAPAQETNLLAVSLNMSSGNPSYEISTERNMESGFETPVTFGVKFAGKEGSMMSMTPWKMEQSVQGNQGTFEWILYDTLTSKEVSSSKPSKVEWMQPKAWFKHRYSSAFRPFTREGGVVFAGDKYSDCISWKVKPGMEGQTMKWELGGSICVTYWPNKHRTFYCETRRVDFSQNLHLPLLRSGL